MGGTRRVVHLDRFGEPSVMRWVEESAAEPRDGEVSVAVDAVGVNFADTMVRRGEYLRDQPIDFAPGFEAAGRVLHDPSGRLSAGTPVAVWVEQGGGYATQVCGRANRVYPVAPGTDPFVVAGLFLQGITALYAVERFARVEAGQAVLVHAAAGGLGGLCTQLCAAADATVIATASTDAKRAIAREHGADHAIAADPETLVREVRERTGGAGCDAVIDGVGGPLFAPSLKALAFRGRYVVVGAASQAPATLDVRTLMPRNQTVVGFIVARIAEVEPGEPQNALDRVLAAHAQGRLRPRIEVLPADELVRVHEMIEARRQVGKYVLDMQEVGT